MLWRLVIHRILEELACLSPCRVGQSLGMCGSAHTQNMFPFLVVASKGLEITGIFFLKNN